MDIEPMILAALRSHAERMAEGAAEARRGASMPDQRKPSVQQANGVMLIDVTPTPEGFAMMGALLKEQSEAATKLADEIEEIGLPALLRRYGCEENPE